MVKGEKLLLVSFFAAGWGRAALWTCHAWLLAEYAVLYQTVLRHNCAVLAHTGTVNMLCCAPPRCCTAQADARYDPVRGLLALAPPRGPARYDFAASLLRGMVEEGQQVQQGAGGGRFDMVWDLVQGMRAAPDGRVRAKYDPLWRWLEEARTEQVGEELRGVVQCSCAAVLRVSGGEDGGTAPQRRLLGDAHLLLPLPSPRLFIHAMRFASPGVPAPAACAPPSVAASQQLGPCLRRLPQEWGVSKFNPLEGMTQWGPASDWDSPAPYDPLPDLFAAIQAGPRASRYDPMASLLGFAPLPAGARDKYDMLSQLLVAMEEHARPGQAPAKFDPWPALVAGINAFLEVRVGERRSEEQGHAWGGGGRPGCMRINW